MAALSRTAANRRRLEVPIRVEKHLRRLGLFSGRDYQHWCRARGFREDFRKDWEELETEWLAHCKEITKAQARAKVDRDPAKLISNVCSGALDSSQIGRPRWRALAERVEQKRLCERDRLALRQVVETIGKRGRLLLAEEVVGGTRTPLLDGLVMFALYSRQWIREPRTWQPRTHNARRQFTSLGRHLFCEFSVPQFLDAAWLRDDASAELFRKWFIEIGLGRNIRDEAGPVHFTNRIVHHFLHAPEQLSIEQALRWGQVVALGGSTDLALALSATRLGEDFEAESFWLSVVRFFVAHPFLDRRHVGPIVDYLYHQKFVEDDVFIGPGERARHAPAQPNLSMQGRTVDSLLRHVERWHTDLSRRQYRGAPSWDRSGIAEFELETGTEETRLYVWKIRELLSFEALRLEGAKMRHCVASYGYSCSSGNVSIWSLERISFKGTEKRVTIEVDRSRRVVQVRGKCNRESSERELSVIRRWAASEGLTIAETLR